MKWMYQVAIGLEFEAKDANEAGQVAEVLATVPTYGGHEIVARRAAWVAAVEDEPLEEPRDSGKPSK